MLAVDDLRVRFGAVEAVDGVSFGVSRGEVVCLLGPSGSGKSTLLRVIAGVERATSGQVVIDGTEVDGPNGFVEPEHRHVGMMFQDYALFPHLTVEANVAFGLDRKSRGTVGPLLEELGLGRLGSSYPHQLSGGERQRVALLRAMAPRPRLLLMDEPFSSLDSRLRDDVRRRTLEFVRASGTTTVIVTHDPDEALRIADRIALLESGRLVQLGTPQQLYTRPGTLFAARFFSDVTALPGTCTRGRVETPLGSFAAALAEGSGAVACVRPQHLRIAGGPTGITGRVLGSEFRGDSRYLLIDVDGLENPVTLRAPCRFPIGADAVQPGAPLYLEVDAEDVPVVALDANIKESLHASHATS
jgi:iron(III) transport system ATP-binding protein